ncbi:MAG: hypothetical protein AMXMBFR46_01510 [Acidimicrobiia bacterium]
MINFRFHVISLIAVFLALAVGVVMGYGVLGQPTVDTLQGRVDTVEARADAIRAENGELRADRARLEAIVEDVDEFAATHRLSGSTAVPVAVRGVDEDRVDQAVRLARRADAVVPGVVWLEPKWGIEREEDAAALARIVNTTATSRNAVRETAARALAARLAGGPAVAGRPDLLAELEAAGFVSTEEVDGVQFDAADFDGRGGKVLLVGGNRAELEPSRGVLPLARALATAGTPVVVADDWHAVDGGPARGAGLAAIRDDDALAEQIATVDNLDAVEGPLTAVLVLGERGQGTIGHYGSGKGAGQAMPAWWIV